MLLTKIKQAANRLYRKAANATVAAPGSYSDDLVPPDWMFSDPDRVDGSHNAQEFVSIGESTASWFIEHEGLTSQHRVLDVGCGIGRIARPLIKYLKDGGSYDGIEIAPYKIEYCCETIGVQFPNFRFYHADVFNKYYTPRALRKPIARTSWSQESSLPEYVGLSRFLNMIWGGTRDSRAVAQW